MAEEGAGTPGDNRGEPAAASADEFVTDGVHPPMKLVKAAIAQAPLYLLIAEPERS